MHGKFWSIFLAMKVFSSCAQEIAYSQLQSNVTSFSKHIDQFKETSIVVTYAPPKDVAGSTVLAATSHEPTVDGDPEGESTD